MERKGFGRDTRGFGRRREEPHAPPPNRAVDIEKKTADLMKSSGIPLQLARQVAVGQIDLNEAIKRLAFQDEVNSLIQRHGFNRALATQIALGQVGKDEMLARRRVDEHIAANRDRSVIDAALAGKSELTVGLLGHRVLRVAVTSVDKYEVGLRDLDSQTDALVHKLQLKYAYSSADSKKARKAMTWDKALKEHTAEPRLRPQDRYACSDRRLGLAMDAKKELEVTLVEGEVFSGQVAWVARYEFGLRGRQGTEIVIFRHSLHNLSGD